MAFHEANVQGQYDAQIKAAQGYLKDPPVGRGREEGPGRPLLRRRRVWRPEPARPLQHRLLHGSPPRDTGLPADDPDLKKALVFVSRCQNLKSEFNDQPWAGKVNDGGFIYTAAEGGGSMAVPPKDENGGLRSYASMTYAGLKSMIHAGLKPDDPRVKAASDYIARHYTLDENPGLGQAGLFYYYQTFAKALTLLGKPTFTDAAGQAHDWRLDLTAALAKRQGPEGSWVNPADRFMEGDPNLVTSYGLLALAYARP